MSSRSVAFFEALKGRLVDTELISINGKVSNVTGIIIESIGPDIQIGDLCEIRFRKRVRHP